MFCDWPYSVTYLQLDVFSIELGCVQTESGDSVGVRGQVL